MKKLGASHVFDYNSATVVMDVQRAIDGKKLAGALAIGKGSADPCLDIVGACDGNKFVSVASFDLTFPDRPGFSLQLVRMIRQFLWFRLSMWFKSRTRGVRTNYIFGISLMNNEVGSLIYVDFLPKALAAGQYVAAPDPFVVGKGFESVQAGFDLQKKGVSAKKVVVSL